MQPSYRQAETRAPEPETKAPICGQAYDQVVVDKSPLPQVAVATVTAPRALDCNKSRAFEFNPTPGKVLARLPAPLHAVLRLVPPQLLFLALLALVLFFASTAVAFLLQRLAYVLPIVLSVSPPLRGFLLVLVVLLGLFNKI
jgi:hypothetical protein